MTGSVVTTQGLHRQRSGGRVPDSDFNYRDFVGGPRKGGYIRFGHRVREAWIER